MRKLRISTRVLALVGLLSLLLIGAGSAGVYFLSRANETLDSLYQDRLAPSQNMAHIEELLLRNRLAIAVSLVTPSAAEIEKNVAEVEANIAEISRLWSEVMRTHMNADQAKAASAFAESRKRFVQEGLRPAMEALRQNRIDEAKDVVVNKVRPLYEPVKAGIEALAELQAKLAREEHAAALDRYRMTRNGMTVAISLGIALALTAAWFTVRGIARALEDAVAATQAVASGDLSRGLAAQGEDEVAALLKALESMRQSLAGVVQGVRTNAECVAAASAQIATGNNDLSARTEEQASALQQTASSMEQLSTTVRQNADNARQANSLAQGACEVTRKGGSVVGQVVDTMKQIDNSSRRIADIISVIDGIAFQTNILALNAAVEAARAGEQGRGFAVVAGEVRALAQRSSQAAKEINTLITESVERVNAGTQLVDQAGSTMREIEAAILRVTDIVGEITQASTEQSQGVTQISEAVTQMDDVTQQNAALVEESTAAASSLRTQAEGLVQAMAVFRVAQAA